MTEVPSQLFEALFEAAPDGMVLVDGDGKIVAINRQVELLFGYAREELVGEVVDALVPPARAEAHARLRTAYTADPKWRPMGSQREFFGRTKSGEDLPVEIMLAPIELDGVTLICAAIRDVTARRAQEQRARHTDMLLRGAIESFHGALAVFDEDDRLTLCNSTYRTFFGTGFGTALGSDIQGQPYAALVDAKLDSGDFDVPEQPRSQLRERWLSYHRQPAGALVLRTADGRHLRVVERRTEDRATISTAIDVTDDVRHADQLQAARQLAEGASSAKSEFLSSMSHELRTPLNAVLGFAQLLQRDRKHPLSARQRDRLGHVVRGGEHLLRLIDDILDLSRIEAGRLAISSEPVRVPDVVTEVVSTLGPVAEAAEVSITVAAGDAGAEGADAEPWVVADRTRLAQILLNLGNNAIKYGRAGGSVELRIDVAEQTVRVVVADDGIGIADRYHDKIFEPFVRAGQETGPIEGTGIGLALCKRLADRMSGTIGFDSAEGVGSTFWVELPRRTPPAAAERRVAAPADGRRRVAWSATVIYVEDNPSNVALMEDFFEDHPNIRLIVAPNAELGVELIRTHRPQLVLMDLHLPGISGFAATERLKQDPATQDIPVVALSAAAMPRDRKRAEQVGFFRYLTKPMRVDELLEVLEAIIPEARGDA